MMDIRDLQELRRRAAEVSGKQVSLNVDSYNDLFVTVDGNEYRMLTEEQLETKLCELATPKMPDFIAVELPTRYLENVADYLSVREIVTRALDAKRRELGIEPPVS